MAIGGNVNPGVHIPKVMKVEHAEGRVVDFILMHVEKHEQRGRVRVSDFGELLETWSVPGVRIQLGGAVDTQAHIVASPPQLIEFDAAEGGNRRTIGRAMVNRK